MKKVFFSFHYNKDSWRASQVRNMGVVDGNKPANDNDWETIKGSDDKIKKWINEQLSGKSCAIVLIGENTVGRKWIKYEIEKAWNDEKGLLGIYIHNLKDSNGDQSNKGRNPFEDFSIGEGNDKKSLANVVKAYNPSFSTSKYVYDHIKENLKDWIEKAIEIRNNY